MVGSGGGSWTWRRLQSCTKVKLARSCFTASSARRPAIASSARRGRCSAPPAPPARSVVGAAGSSCELAQRVFHHLAACSGPSSASSYALLHSACAFDDLLRVVRARRRTTAQRPVSSHVVQRRLPLSYAPGSRPRTPGGPLAASSTLSRIWAPTRPGACTSSLFRNPRDSATRLLQRSRFTSSAGSASCCSGGLHLLRDHASSGAAGAPQVLFQSETPSRGTATADPAAERSLPTPFVELGQRLSRTRCTSCPCAGLLVRCWRNASRARPAPSSRPRCCWWPCRASRPDETSDCAPSSSSWSSSFSLAASSSAASSSVAMAQFQGRPTCSAAAAPTHAGLQRRNAIAHAGQAA